jgi:hypothetical protein
MIIGITMQQPSSDGPQSSLANSSSMVEPNEKDVVVDNNTTKVVMDSAAAVAYESSSSSQIIQHHHHHHLALNGGTMMPLQQVYVNSPAELGNHMSMLHHPGSMAGLESQFQSLGLRQEEGTTSSTDPSSDPNGDVDEDDEDDNEEGDEGEDDPIKLFVGQVSKCSSWLHRQVLTGGALHVTVLCY